MRITVLTVHLAVGIIFCSPYCCLSVLLFLRWFYLNNVQFKNSDIAYCSIIQYSAEYVQPGKKAYVNTRSHMHFPSLYSWWISYLSLTWFIPWSEVCEFPRVKHNLWDVIRHTQLFLHNCFHRTLAGTSVQIGYRIIQFRVL